MPIVFITGANGFIGRNLCITLKEKGFFVRGVVRNNVRDVFGADEYVQVGDIDESTDWQQALVGVDTVIHLAGRVHIMDSRWSLLRAWIPAFAGMTRVAGMTRGGNDKLHVFRKVNVLGTERLARMAVETVIICNDKHYVK